MAKRRQRKRDWLTVWSWFFARRFFKIAKRTIDICVSLVACVVLSPIFALTYILVRLDGGPAIYWQRRVGLDGRTFLFPKFRSMRVVSDIDPTELQRRNQYGAGAVTFKDPNDPRITRVGKFIRKFSIDELPQIWCVLKGDMTLVGPRPALPSEVDKYTYDQRLRLCVEPGLTSLWAIRGRSELTFDQQVELDKEYIGKRSVLGDLWILLKTVPAVIKGKGAY